VKALHALTLTLSQARQRVDAKRAMRRVRERGPDAAKPVKAV